MWAVTLYKEDVFKGPTSINDAGACATLASKRLLSRLIQFPEKSRSGKKYHFNIIVNGKTWHKQVSNFDVFNVFHH